MDHTSIALLTLADRLTAVEAKVSNVSRPQLAHSSIVDGAIDQIKMVDTGQVDDNGFPIFTEEVVSRIGEQDDGGNGVTVFDGPTPPRPVNFSVAGGPGILTVEWLGEFEDRYEPYSDHAYVNVHVSTLPDFTPDASTIKAAILSPQGEQVTISGLEVAPYYVTLVAVSQAGIWSLPAPFDGDDTTSQIDPVWVADIEAKVDDANAKADAAVTASAAAEEAARLASADATSARDAASQAQADATTALSAANGKSTVFYSTTEPDPTKGADGDTWYRRTATAFGTITGAWERRSGVWESRHLTDQVIDSLSAGKITSGTLGVGQVITVGSPAPGGSFLQIGNSSITTYREDIEGNWVPALQLGGANDPSDPLTLDQIRLVDPSSGEAMVGMDATGLLWADSMVTTSLSINGAGVGNYLADPDDLLSPFPRGRVATFVFPSANYPQANTELGLAEVAWDMQQNRLYRIVFDGTISSAANSSWRLFIRYVGSEGADVEAPAPSITNATQLSTGFFGTGVDGRARCHLEAEVGIGLPERQGRALLTLQRLYGGYPSLFWDGRAVLYVDDIGVYAGAVGGSYGQDGQLNTGGGTPYSGGGGSTGTTTPTKTKKTYTKTYSASWSQSYTGSNSPMGTNEIRQGYSGSYGQMKGAIGFPSRVQSDLAGATISKMEVYLYANHWYYNSGGTLTIGTHSAPSSPSSFPGSNTVVTSTKWGSKSGGKWVTLPSSIHPYWTSGNNKGVTVGVGAGSSSSYYARLNGYGMSYAPKLRITYTK